MPFSVPDFFSILLAFGVSLALTPLVRALARRWGAVARPRADRWHKKPTAMLGGVAIFATVAAVYLTRLPHTPQTWSVLGASAFLWLVGFVDDFCNLKPYQKLIGQVMGAAIVTAAGLGLPWTPSPALNLATTIFWLVGITNAVNILDNMDGLAAGVAAIGSVFLGLNFLDNGQTADALLLAVFAAALVGFLVYNANPASIFMGDCGSLFIGFFLASAALLSPFQGRSRSLLPVLAVPVLVLCIPIFDVTLVTVLRKLAGRPASQGGRDHTSHRLVALGLSERHAVWLLYGLAACAGFLALLVRRLELDVSLTLIAGFTLLLTLLGVYLAGVQVYAEAEVAAARGKPLVAFLVDLSYKRRVFEVLLDVTLIILAYHTASRLLFGPVHGDRAWQQFLSTVPVLVFVKMAVFLLAGVYRGLWRYVSVENLILYAKAVILGSLGSGLAVLLLFRGDAPPAVVFTLDGLILLVLLGGSRIAFRLFRSLLPPSAVPNGQRVLIYGAGDAGELLLRELRNNRALSYLPVGFLDDDPLKEGKVIHGLRVLGGNGSLQRLLEQHQVQEVLISSARFSPERVREILRVCGAVRVTLRRLRIELEPVRVDEN
jgi:UDP-GlcNAc:undecaprenyl-phosphate GlcNAc-1-phosphate transferase